MRTAERKMSPIAGRLVQAMQEHGYSELTQRMYQRAVRHLVDYYDGRSPELISVAEAHRYVRHLKQSEAGASTIGNHGAAVRFLFEVVFGKEWKPVSPLRRRMLEDMDLRGFSVKTQLSYVRSVAALARYFKRSPDTLSDEEIRRYFVHLKVERGLARQTVTIALCGIKFLYETTLKPRTCSLPPQEFLRRFLHPSHRPPSLSASLNQPTRLTSATQQNPCPSPPHVLSGRLVQHRVARRAPATCKPFQCWSLSISFVQTSSGIMSR